ncbi:MAG: Zn-dependent protease [Bdellovibrio sp.]|nr:Zn-dependent protease [Bdellovibrio sp.]
MKKYLESFSQRLFADLKINEEVSLAVSSEESDFIRFNQSKIRQNTSVNQHDLMLTYQSNQRLYKTKFSLTLDLEVDLKFALAKIKLLREQLNNTDENPQFFAMENNGTSEVYKKNDRPDTTQLMALISDTFKDSDLAGFWTSGPIRQASINSKGQFHYFETDSFFFDYSLYNGPRAAKGFYSSAQWNEKAFLAKAHESKNTLSLLSRPQVKVSPGAYKSYLEPMALAEIMGMFSGGALSRNSYEQGYAPLKKLNEKEKLLSKQFSLIEDNTLSFDTHFNSIGEIVPDKLPLIENGELKNFLTSTATAKEYKLQSNQADPTEALRSFEVRAGTLEKSEVLNNLGKGLYLSNLHYINWSDVQAARITGMTRFACFWVEGGEIVGPIQDLRFDDTIYNLFGDNFGAFTKHQEIFTSTSTYLRRSMGGMKVPGVIINSFNFTL